MWIQGYIYFVAPGVIILISTQLDGNFIIMQTSEIKKMEEVQKKFCTSIDDAHYWAVSSAVPGCTIPRARFNKHKNQYVLVGQHVVYIYIVSM